MKRTCSTCPNPGRKAPCCKAVFCGGCLDQHTHPELLAVDPKRWRAEHAPEEELTTQVIAALNALPGVTAWRTKRRQGARKSDDLDGVPDVQGFVAPLGRALFVETKRNHPAGCPCKSCENQRDFAARAKGSGCIVLTDIRSVKQAVKEVQVQRLDRREDCMSKFVAKSLLCAACGQSNITQVRKGVGTVDIPNTKKKRPVLILQIEHADGRECVSPLAAMFDPDKELGLVLVDPLVRIA